MEKEAQKYVLDNISKALTHANKNQLVSRIASFERDTGLSLTLENFLEFNRLQLDDIYKKSSWSRLCALAGVRTDFEDTDETVLARGLRRFSHNDSAPQLTKLLSFLDGSHQKMPLESFPLETQRLLSMFCFSIWNNKPPEQSLSKNIERLKENTVIWAEALELISFLIKQADTVVHDVVTIPRMSLVCACPVYS